jgi:hypothetical protein
MWGGMQVPPRTPAAATTSSATNDFPVTEVSHAPRPAHARAPPDHVLTSLCLLSGALDVTLLHPDQAQGNANDERAFNGMPPPHADDRITSHAPF